MGTWVMIIATWYQSTVVNTRPSVWRITDSLDGTTASVTVPGSLVQADVFFG